jgi:hypothetical protein
MKQMNVAEKMKFILEPRQAGIKARLFVTRDDGITIYDSVQNQTTTSVSALVSGVWQASEALIGLTQPNQDVMEFRLGFDTSSQGIYLMPFSINGKKYFFGAIYHECLNPGQLKRQVVLIKEEMDRLFQIEPTPTKTSITKSREEYLFQEITDEEIDRLFSVGGI